MEAESPSGSGPKNWARKPQQIKKVSGLIILCLPLKYGDGYSGSRLSVKLSIKLLCAKADDKGIIFYKKVKSIHDSFDNVIDVRSCVFMDETSGELLRPH